MLTIFIFFVIGLDLMEVLARFKKKKLCKKTISASCVYVPDCILIKNLKPGISLDNIELYFENERRSGGGPVREVNFNEGEDEAVVFFENWEGNLTLFLL